MSKSRISLKTFRTDYNNEECDESYFYNLYLQYEKQINGVRSLKQNNYISAQNTNTNTDGKYKYSEQFKWEKHSSGVASKILDKMGYKGKGLGKSENGITEPITIDSSQRLGAADLNKKKGEKRKVVCILSDSMLNRIDENRLCKDIYDIKLQCHGGCTVQCMYTHLPWAFKQLPEYMLLHIGTNDCLRKTSDEVITEIMKLKDTLEKYCHRAKYGYRYRQSEQIVQERM